LSVRKAEGFPRPLGFNEARRRAISALASEQSIGHEVRGDLPEKNLLATGEVAASFVAKLLGRCLGTQYSSSRHHILRDTEVPIFRPVLRYFDFEERWYIKLYFVDQIFFISVHLSGLAND